MTATAPEPLPQYAWPPLPVLDIDEAAELLADRLARIYAALEAERERIIAAAEQGRRRLVLQRLDEFQDAVAVFMEQSDAAVRGWLTQHLTGVYEAGGSAFGLGQLTWTQAHVTALTSLATDTYNDFLRRAQDARRVSEAFARAVRKVSGETLAQIAGGGKTARQVGQELADRLRDEYGIDHVTYRDGTRVPVDQYARMAARTKSAVAYNAGGLNQAHAHGITYVEVFDGADCGWSTHEDLDKANGTVRPIDEAATYAISHPNCRRGFGPRPDVRSPEGAKAAQPTTSAEQRADAADFERAQVTSVTARARERARLLRAAKRTSRSA